MIVLTAVEKAVQTARRAYTEGGDTEPFNEVSFGRLVAIQTIANVLDLEFSEIAHQYISELGDLSREKEVA